MKKVNITGKKQFEIEELPIPQPTWNWALVKIIVAPMCTEYKDFRAGNHCECLGHEAAGEVVDIQGEGTIRIGDRVVVMPQYPCGECDLCQAGDYIYCENAIDFFQTTGSKAGAETYAQYIIKPSWLLAKIPDDMSYEHASMLCCGLGPTFGAMEQMGTGSSHTLMITGLGPVGLGGIINGVSRGARVIGVSRNKYRNKLAKDLGAELILDPEKQGSLEKIMEITDGKGVDMSVECAGAELAQKLCLDATRRRGQVAFVGESGDLTLGVSDQLIRKGLTLHGIWHYNLKHIPKIFEIAGEHGPLLDKMITHRYPLRQVADAWELQSSGKCGKVILYPWN